MNASLDFNFPGGKFFFNIVTEDTEVAKELCNVAGYVAIGVTTLAILYRNNWIRPLIDKVVNAVFGRERDDQDILKIKPGSLHVLLHCFTDERFLEVLIDYESGGIKERLQKEFLQAGIKVEGLKVEIENMEEVDKIKAAINQKSYYPTKVMAEGNISARIIVQGGSYKSMPSDMKEEHKRATKESARAGYARLMNGGTAVDAVEAAVLVLENNEYFNAGYGSLLNKDGEVECDAMIMEGHTLKCGAVISGRHFLNPVSLCKKIMYESPHCALSGDGALEFAKEKGFPICAPKELITKSGRIKDYYCYGKPVQETHDTVSAVAMDRNGRLACAMSTGGMVGKLKGRVGDVPLIGCGGYVNEKGGATVTGYGESIMRLTLARDVVYNMENGLNAQESAEKSLAKMKRLVHSVGGVITIDEKGNFGKAFNTHTMVWASIKDDDMESAMEEDEDIEIEPM